MTQTQVRRFLAVLFVLVLGLGAVACGSDTDSGDNTGGSEEASQSESAADGLEGVTWEVMNIASNQGWATSLPREVPPPTLRIEDGQATIFAGCNSGSGSVEVGEASLEFGPVAMTKKSCDEIRNQVEFLVNKVLQGMATYEISSEGNLAVERKGNSLIFRRS